MLTFDINNQRTLSMTQSQHDGKIKVTTGTEAKTDSEYYISPGDMVMLLNYYRVQKESGKELL